LTFLDHALALAARGFAVFPLMPSSKEPYKPSRGFFDAVTDLETIRVWWDRAPDSNLGLRPAPGVIVLDVDPRNGGDTTLKSLESLYGPLPNTLTAKTGGGGVHAFFRVPEELAWPKELATGIDIKANNGYVLAAPSVHDKTGQRYEWLTPLDTPIAEAPSWVLAQGYKPDERAPRVVVEEEERTTEDVALDRVVAELRPHFVQGKKHYICKALGGWMKQRGFGFSDAAYVITKLLAPLGIDPAGGIGAAKWSFGVDKPTGWTELVSLIGKPAADGLDASTPNPRRVREQADLEAARALIPVPPPLPPGLNPAPLPAAQVAPFTQAIPEPRTFDAPDDMIARLRRLQNQGPAHSTGLPPLDKALRGGMRVEKVMIVGGAPGAGKTALLRQVADFMCRTGVCVGWLAGDEEPSAIDGRRLQAIGVRREVAEQPDEPTLNLAAQVLAPLPFMIYDAAEGWTVERAFADLAARYPDQPRAFFGDSVQTVRTERTVTIESERKKIDDILMTAKALARSPATRAMVAFTSELNRGSYRSEDSAEATSDLAAFKESGGIEYYAHILLLLRSVKGEGAYVTVSMPKNRLGPKVDSILKIDFETTNLTESFDDPRLSQMKAAAELAIPGVRQVLESTGWPGVSQNTVEKMAQGEKRVVRFALQVMRDRGIAQFKPGPRGAMLWSLVPNGVTAPAGDYAPPPIGAPLEPEEP
jgi:hypothetical protein